ncbi:MAG: ArsR family transcriptional regulator [Ardenticatenaceae bacterium]|nr:ArsR family transcriptional regulator [Ardenticatenaceae bacterium]
MTDASGLRSIVSEQMNDTRAALIQEIKQCGQCTVEHLSDCLQITPTAVRQHLATLERDGLVGRTKATPQGVGRPGYVYRLTSRAQDLFPASYRQFALDLLTGLIELDGIGKVEQLFERRRRLMAAQYRPHLEGKPFAERIAELARLRSQAGYMTGWEQLDDNMFLIREAHCPLIGVAETCPQLCHEDLRMFADLLGANVVIQEHMASGDSRCCYRVTPVGS